MFRKHAPRRIHLILLIVIFCGSVLLLPRNHNNGDPVIGSLPEVLAAGRAAAYDPAWTRQFGTGEQDFTNAITTGPDGDLYLTGSTFGDLQGFNQGHETPVGVTSDKWKL